jgi:hypothetical protein
MNVAYVFDEYMIQNSHICRMKVILNFTISKLFFFVLMSSSFVFAHLDLLGQENTYNVVIPWDASKEITVNEQVMFVPSIKNQGYNGKNPFFAWQTKVNDFLDYAVKVNNLTFYDASAEDLTFLSINGINVPTEPEINTSTSISRADKFVHVSLNPFLKVDGVIKRISSFKVELESKPMPATKKDFVGSSVLGDINSRWYKISVSQDGIYKIDQAFLVSLGIDVSNLNPSHINIYGNGFGKLPELNSVYRPDDLVKNDILVVGEGDGSFDSNDYILFHGWGPNRIYQVGNELQREMNPYSGVSCYFIRISESDIPGRVQVEASIETPNENVNSFNYFSVYEQELKSLVGGGQRWYGDLFDEELTKSFSFNVPNIVTSSPAKFRISAASNPSSGLNSVQLSIGSEVLTSFSLPTVAADYARVEKTFEDVTPQSSMPLTMTVSRSNPAVMTYLDKIELNARASLIFSGNQMYFRDLLSVGGGKISSFTIENFNSNSFVWNVTNRQKPVLEVGSFNGNSYSFVTRTDSLKTFVVSNGSNFLTPNYIGTVVPQNLHALDYADLLIVTPVVFKDQAERLANLHRNEGLLVHVVTTDQIYNEFSSGSLDVTAIKWFAKMFFDRANGNPDLMPKNLLLFGDGTYDPKGIVSNVNYIPTYQVLNSENHIDALVTDDYFGMMNDNESLGNADAMDLGVGRLLISSNQIAKEQVDKIEIYITNGANLMNTSEDCCSGNSNVDGTFGDWRLNYVQIADDEEGGYFITQDCEPQYEEVTANHPEMNADKLYTDAFVQVSGAGGQRYPDVYDAITNRVQRGALVVNYVGHGGEAGAALERIITISQILSWTNLNKMNLFVSATCEFTKYDDPSRVSAGEWVSLNPAGGAIALMTTTRSVYFDVNSTTGERFYENVFQRDNLFQPLTFGEIMRRTKNSTNEGINKRSFTLIGDPALKIALPKYRIVTDSINHMSPNLVNDTIEALSKMNIKGHLEDFNGNVLTNYQGVLSPTVFDKPKLGKTLAQDPTSPVLEFSTQRNSMYKGKASIKDGYFDFTFVVPKDINYAFGNGKISYYANNTDTDAFGEDKRFVVGGLNSAGLNDNVAPTVELYLNDQNFVSGGLTDESPKLIAEVFDENGVNTVGNGIGHDIVAILDNNTSDPILLNDYYTAILDSYQSGKVSYDFSGLSVGNHTLTFKVWDVNNNSSETSINFTVVEKQEISLDHVLNYPNPFTTKTQFFFEHNQVCETLESQIQIFTVSGKLVKTINQSVRTAGFRTEGIDWDGRDDFGDQIGKGVYIYKISVRNPEGEIAEKVEKLVLLR